MGRKYFLYLQSISCIYKRFTHLMSVSISQGRGVREKFFVRISLTLTLYTDDYDFVESNYCKKDRLNTFAILCKMSVLNFKFFLLNSLILYIKYHETRQTQPFHPLKIHIFLSPRGFECVLNNDIEGN